jgi:predicted small metal-binding protein
MSLVVRCRDVGFDCEGVVKADTEEQLLSMVAEHAQTVHNVKEITPELVAKVKSVVREEK